MCLGEMKPVLRLLLVLLSIVACTARNENPDPIVEEPPPEMTPPPAAIAKRPLNGSALMLTTNDKKLLVLNRRTGNGGKSSAVKLEKYSVDLASDAMSLEAAVDVPGARQLIIAPDDDTAYVAGESAVWKFTGVSGNGIAEAGRGVAGAEP